MRRLLTPVILSLGVWSCTEPNVVSTTVGFPDPHVSSPERIGELWVRSCAFCHVDGNAGAPLVGDAEAWGPRLAQGKDVLVDNTINGIGNMPPLGYCMACERQDFLALIELMTAGIEAVNDE